MTRPSRAGWVRFPHSPATIAYSWLLVAVTAWLPNATAGAQGVDSALTGVGPRTLCKPSGRDSTRVPSVPRVVIAGQVQRVLPDCKVPLSPRTALVRSLLVPGLGQFQLNRRKAGALFVATEVGSIGMVLKSRSDLSRATAARRDTIVVPVLDAAGEPVIDPVTGLPKTVVQVKDKNLADRVRARRTHLEDWIAAIVFNHLFSGADAWVAANLADFDANVEITSASRGIQFAARFAW